MNSLLQRGSSCLSDEYDKRVRHPNLGCLLRQPERAIADDYAVEATWQTQRHHGQVRFASNRGSRWTCAVVHFW